MCGVGEKGGVHATGICNQCTLQGAQMRIQRFTLLTKLGGEWLYDKHLKCWLITGEVGRAGQRLQTTTLAARWKSGPSEPRPIAVHGSKGRKAPEPAELRSAWTGETPVPTRA